MKAWGGSGVWLEVWLHALTLATGVDQVSASSSGHFTTGSHWIWKWIGRRVGLLNPSGIKLRFRGLIARSLLTKLLQHVTWYFPYTYDGLIAPPPPTPTRQTLKYRRNTQWYFQQLPFISPGRRLFHPQPEDALSCGDNPPIMMNTLEELPRKDCKTYEYTKLLLYTVC